MASLADQHVHATPLQVPPLQGKQTRRLSQYWLVLHWLWRVHWWVGGGAVGGGGVGGRVPASQPVILIGRLTRCGSWRHTAVALGPPHVPPEAPAPQVQLSTQSPSFGPPMTRYGAAEGHAHHPSAAAEPRPPWRLSLTSGIVMLGSSVAYALGTAWLPREEQPPETTSHTERPKRSSPVAHCWTGMVAPGTEAPMSRHSSTSPTPSPGNTTICGVGAAADVSSPLQVHQSGSILINSSHSKNMQAGLIFVRGFGIVVIPPVQATSGDTPIELASSDSRAFMRFRITTACAFSACAGAGHAVYRSTATKVAPIPRDEDFAMALGAVDVGTGGGGERESERDETRWLGR